MCLCLLASPNKYENGMNTDIGGYSLAMAQIYIILASLFRRYDLELHETIRERDLDIVRDCFLGEVRSDTKGIRVRYASRRNR